jgi:hypothetical protein
MAGDRHDLMSRRATLGQPSSHGFAKAMSRAMWQVGLAAPILERVSETGGCEWAAIFGGQQRQMARRRSVNDGRKVGM